MRMWQEELSVSTSTDTHAMFYLLLEGCGAGVDEFGKHRKEV